jgi:hypothetical protein
MEKIIIILIKMIKIINNKILKKIKILEIIVQIPMEIIKIII